MRAGFLIVSLFFCQRAEAEDKRVTIAASIRPLALLAQDLLGSMASVSIIVPANVDPHNMSLKASMRSKISDAELVLWLGPEFERFLVKPVSRRGAGTSLAVGDIGAVFKVGAEFGARDVHDHHGEGLVGDLHVWLNPESAKTILRALTERVVRLRPEMESHLGLRLVALLKGIDLATEGLRARLLPYRGMEFGVHHNAYTTFSEVFELKTVAAVTQMPEQRLSAKHLHQMQKDMTGASCLVVERLSAKTERLARVLRVRAVEVDPLASDDKLIKTYIDFLFYLGEAFESCFADKKPH